MADITKLKDLVQKAQHAGEVLNNQPFKNAMEAVEKQYLDAMLTADEKDDLGRFRYAEAIKVVRLVARHLRIATGNWLRLT